MREVRAGAKGYLLRILLFYTSHDHLSRGSTTMMGLSLLPHQSASRKYPPVLPAVQSDRGSSSVEVASSKMTLSCINSTLRKKKKHHLTFCVRGWGEEMLCGKGHFLIIGLHSPCVHRWQRRLASFRAISPLFMVSLLQCWFCLVIERNLRLQAWEAGTLQLSCTLLKSEVLNKDSVPIQKGKGSQDSNPVMLVPLCRFWSYMDTQFWANAFQC